MDDAGTVTAENVHDWPLTFADYIKMAQAKVLKNQVSKELDGVMVDTNAISRLGVTITAKIMKQELPGNPILPIEQIKDDSKYLFFH